MTGTPRTMGLAPDPTLPDAAFTAETLRVAALAFDRVMTGEWPQLDPMPELEPADALRWVGDRVTELVAGFAELPLERLVDLAVPTPPPSDREGGHAPRGEPLTLVIMRGGLGEVRIWIHSIGDLPNGTLRFRLTDLQPSTGEPLPGGLAVFAPAEITIPSSAATSTVLRYPVPAGAPTGRYDGLVLAHGIADAVVPLTLVIT